MKTRPSLALVLIFVLFISINAQTPTPAPAPTPSSTQTPAQTQTPTTTPSPTPPPQQQEQVSDEDVVRITTNLVQVDAIITDKDGRQVTDLRPEEVQIYEDGRPQKITHFSYIKTDNNTTTQPVAATKPNKPAAPADKYAPPPPPVHLRPEQVRRTIAIVVDDLGLSFTSTAYVRYSLKKFIDQQVQPGDLVAIIRTAGGIGALQQFTSDKQQLYAAVERVKWYPMGRGGVSAVAPISSDALSQNQTPGMDSSDSSTNSAGEDIDQFREELFSVGTLGALNYVVKGMRELPGRKSILLVSDGIKIFNSDDPTRTTRVLDALRRLTDLANRASVVIYTMDARGLQTLELTAADDVGGMSGGQIETQLSNRRAGFFESQNGLNYLAAQTGGIFIRNTNDLAGGIKRVLDDQSGYYLIGYRPDESTFDRVKGRARFHKLSAKVKRPGLKVRLRSGFFGVTDEEAQPQRTPAQEMASALSSPFAAGGVHLRLTSLYANDAKAGSYMRSLLHIDLHDLTFTDEADGWHKAVFDVLAITFGDNGMVVGQPVARAQTIRLRGDTYQKFLNSGLVYLLTFPVKKAGAYQLRTALRDEPSQRIGSASQFIEVPDLNKNRLALSGIILSGSNPVVQSKPQQKEPSANDATQPSPANAAATDEEGISETDPMAGPAVRQFKNGMYMQYNYYIYNAQLDKATGHPQLQTQMRLFQNGQQIFAGSVRPFNPGTQPDMKRLTAGGDLKLGTDLAPGEYVLQIVVTDPLAKEKYRTATQWIDFEIVK